MESRFKGYRWDLLILGVYILLAVLMRTTLHIAANVELVTAVSIAAGLMWRNRYLQVATPLLTLFISDSILGNRPEIMVFTWSAYMLAPIFGKYLRGLTEYKPNLMLGSVLAASGFTIFFYLWTNFGVMLVGQLYTRDLVGLMNSYYNGLPFLWPQLLGNLVFVPVVVLASQYLKEIFGYNTADKLEGSHSGLVR